MLTAELDQLTLVMTIVIMITIRVIASSYQVHTLNTLLSTLHTLAIQLQFIDKEIES